MFPFGTFINILKCCLGIPRVQNGGCNCRPACPGSREQLRPPAKPQNIRKHALCMLLIEDCMKQPSASHNLQQTLWTHRKVVSRIRFVPMHQTRVSTHPSRQSCKLHRFLKAPAPIIATHAVAKSERNICHCQATEFRSAGEGSTPAAPMPNRRPVARLRLSRWADVVVKQTRQATNTTGLLQPAFFRPPTRYKHNRAGPQATNIGLLLATNTTDLLQARPAGHKHKRTNTTGQAHRPQTQPAFSWPRTQPTFFRPAGHKHKRPSSGRPQATNTTGTFSSHPQATNTTGLFQAARRPQTQPALFQATRRPQTQPALFQATRRPQTQPAFFQATSTTGRGRVRKQSQETGWTKSGNGLVQIRKQVGSCQEPCRCGLTVS